jgi:hypothetical protein
MLLSIGVSFYKYDLGGWNRAMGKRGEISAGIDRRRSISPRSGSKGGRLPGAKGKKIFPLRGIRTFPLLAGESIGPNSLTILQQEKTVKEFLVNIK